MHRDLKNQRFRKWRTSCIIRYLLRMITLIMKKQRVGKGMKNNVFLDDVFF